MLLPGLSLLAFQQSSPSITFGTDPPELVSGKDQWVGTDKAWKLADLKGKVVWLEFGVLG